MKADHSYCDYDPECLCHTCTKDSLECCRDDPDHSELPCPIKNCPDYEKENPHDYCIAYCEGECICKNCKKDSLDCCLLHCKANDDICPIRKCPDYDKEEEDNGQ